MSAALLLGLRSRLNSDLFQGARSLAVRLERGEHDVRSEEQCRNGREWSAAFEAALTTTRRGDLEHRTNAAYVAGYVRRDLRECQRVRMAKNR
jgi:hypothetical protein